MNQIEENATVSVRDLSAVTIRGPRSLLGHWLTDPDLPQTLPGFSVGGQPEIKGFVLQFLEDSQRRITEHQESRGLLIQGNLESLTRRDFRRLLIHVTKAALFTQGRSLVHAACVLGPCSQVILLCGGQGSGKSTLAMLLAAKGYKIVATDITLLNGGTHALAGSSHVTLYPHLLTDLLSQQSADIQVPQTGLLGYEKKIRLSPQVLNDQDIFHAGNDPLRVTHLFRVALHADSTDSDCAELSIHEKLRTSLLLAEEWAISAWLCPSWEMFLPRLRSARGEELRQRAALQLAERTHWSLSGNFNDAVGSVIRVVG